MKTCQTCKESKPFTAFSKNKTKPDGLQQKCRTCVNEYNKQYYKQTPEKNEARNLARIRGREKARDFVFSYLLSHPCVDCGEKNPIVLEFDHLKDKSFSIANAVRDGFSAEKIASEIEKCEVRCANCHRIVTSKRGNWWMEGRVGFEPTKE